MSSDLAILRCPFCKSKLKYINTFSVQCSCDTYPVIKNIIYLKKEKKDRALFYLARGNTIMATLYLLDSRKIAHFILVFLPFVSFQVMLSMLSLAYPSGALWWNHLKQRRRRATHLLSLATISGICTNNLILDVGCGAGHFLDTASRWASPKTIIGIDISFFLLYCARKYFVPQTALLICADIERGLPIQNHIAHRIFMNDCFMYIRNKQFVLQEIKRIVAHKGAAFLTHVHMSGAHNVGQGFGISPIQMASLVKNMFSFGFLSDPEFFQSVINNANIYYIQKFQDVAHKSYSYQLTPRGKKAYTVAMLPSLRRYLRSISIDFTEDEELKPR